MPRFSRRLGALCAGTLVCLGLTVGAVTAKPGASGGDALRHYQAHSLDPQADRGSHVVLPPHSASMPAGMHTMANHTMANHTMADHTMANMVMPRDAGGMWEYAQPFDSKFNAVHEIASPDGKKVLLVAGSGNSIANFRAGTFRSFMWIPSTDERREVPTPKDLFCSGHVLLPDGRALVVGGTASYRNFTGTKTMYAFNFETERYERLSDMKVGRWYPSVIQGPDGRSLIVSGYGVNGKITKISEVFDYRTNSVTPLAGRHRFALYPRMFLAADGRYFYTGTPPGGSMPAGFWDPLHDDSFHSVAGPTLRGQRVASTSCFVGDVRDQNLIVMGGGWPATDSTNLIKLDDPQPAFREGPRLLAPKGYLSCLNLPDGTMFEANGGGANRIEQASTEAAFLDTIAGPWISANPLPDGEHRLYHAMLFLLDDGRVVSMTSNPTDGDPRSTSLLIYSPPYLFKGTRPVIDSAPEEMTLGGTYAVDTSATEATVDRLTLTAASSPTHDMDNNQRYVSLPLTDSQITLPASPTILPPGWYRLWAVDSLGRVSTCVWVHLDV